MCSFLADTSVCAALSGPMQASGELDEWVLQRSLAALLKELALVDFASMQVSVQLQSKVLPRMRERMLDIVCATASKEAILQPSLLWTNACNVFLVQTFNELIQYASQLVPFLQTAWDRVLAIPTTSGPAICQMLAEVRAVFYRMRARWSWNTRQAAACVVWSSAPPVLVTIALRMLSAEACFDRCIESLDKTFFAGCTRPAEPAFSAVEYFLSDEGMPDVPVNRFAIASDGKTLEAGARPLVLYVAGEGAGDVVIGMRRDLLDAATGSGRPLAGVMRYVPLKDLPELPHPCARLREANCLVSRDGTVLHATQNVVRAKLRECVADGASRNAVKSLVLFGPTGEADFRDKYGYRVIREYGAPDKTKDVLLIGWTSIADGKLYIGAVARVAEAYATWSDYLRSTVSPPVSQECLTVDTSIASGPDTPPTLQFAVPSFIAYVYPPMMCELAAGLRIPDFAPAASVTEALQAYIMRDDVDVHGFDAKDVPLSCSIGGV